MKTFSEFRYLLESLIKTELELKEDFIKIQSQGTTYLVYLMWRGKPISLQTFFPQSYRPSRKDVLDEIQKIYPDAILLSYIPCRIDPARPFLHTGDLSGPKRY